MFILQSATVYLLKPTRQILVFLYKLPVASSFVPSKLNETYHASHVSFTKMYFYLITGLQEHYILSTSAKQRLYKISYTTRVSGFILL